MKNKVRIGIASFAHYHANFWAQAINNSSSAELVGIWDDDENRGKMAAGNYFTNYYHNLQELLLECDGIGIVSETSKHPELVEAAVKANVNIILEKPMAIDMDGCSRIYQAVHNSGLLFMQNLPKRYDPINHELVDLVRRGDIGKILMVRIRHGNYHLLDLGEKANDMWYADPTLSGGGALIDEGVHAADFLYWLLGEPEQVYSSISSKTLGLKVEDSAIAIFTYQSGTIAEICTSNSFVAGEESIEVYGTNGSAILSGVDLASKDFSSQPFLKVFQQKHERGSWKGHSVIPQFQRDDFHHQGINFFIDCLLSGKRPIVNLDDAWKSIAMITSAYKSASTGKAQTIKFPDKL